jgi:hypothetical protein
MQGSAQGLPMRAKWIVLHSSMETRHVLSLGGRTNDTRVGPVCWMWHPTNRGIRGPSYHLYRGGMLMTGAVNMWIIIIQRDDDTRVHRIGARGDDTSFKDTTSMRGAKSLYGLSRARPPW